MYLVIYVCVICITGRHLWCFIVISLLNEQICVLTDPLRIGNSIRQELRSKNHLMSY